MANKVINAAIVVLVLLVLLGLVYLKGKRDADRAAYVRTLQDKIDALEAENVGLQKQRTEIQQDTQRGAESVKQLAKQADTPQKAVAAINKEIPGLGLSFSEPAKGESLPDTPSVVMPNENVFKLLDYTTAKQVCDVELRGCRQEVTNLEAQVGNLSKENALQKDITKEERKSKGFWAKARWFAIGIGAGAAVGYAAAH